MASWTVQRRGAADLDCPALFPFGIVRDFTRRSADPCYRPLIAQHRGPMTIHTKMLSSDMLPPGLDERQRIRHFTELVRSFSDSADFDPAPDVRFRAAMRSTYIGSTIVGSCDGTFAGVRRERRHVLDSRDNRYCLTRNTGTLDAQVVHGRREFTVRPSAL